MLFNFGKKPNPVTAAPKVAPKAAASGKPAAKVAVKVSSSTTKMTSSDSRPNPTPEAYVDSTTDFFAFARKLPDWMKQKKI